MKIKVVFFILGFVSCLGLLILSLFLIYSYESNTIIDNKPKFDIDSNAYKDDEVCPNYPFDTLVGKWSGEK